MTIFEAQHIHLTGIKGVAMTSLAQCLIDLGKSITGSDVKEDFVTKEVLTEIEFSIFPFGEIFTQAKPDLVIYTSAHGGPHNPEVKQARENDIFTISHAEALAQLFNRKQGVAVCGVGGKSTTSAMITWILEKTGQQPSFSVGVGKIVGLARTGRWVDNSKYFVAEADEYVTDPSALDRGEPITPRFSFMKPQLIVCTNLEHDHPDVYKTFADTQRAYQHFFSNLQPAGSVIINGDNQHLVKLVHSVNNLTQVGEHPHNDWILLDYQVENQTSIGKLKFQNHEKTVKLPIPGKFNIKNGLYALAACYKLGIDLDQAIEALASFQSTQRRFEYRGELEGVKFYDDYAHHPSEVKASIEALNLWHPHNRKIIAFQPHTYSRTKQLFTQFVDAFSQADNIVLLDIFASARESFDPDITSEQLATTIQQKYPDKEISILEDVNQLATWLKQQTKADDVVITLGAGDVYKVYEKLFNH